MAVAFSPFRRQLHLTRAEASPDPTSPRGPASTAHTTFKCLVPASDRLWVHRHSLGSLGPSAFPIQCKHWLLGAGKARSPQIPAGSLGPKTFPLSYECQIAEWFTPEAAAVFPRWDSGRNGEVAVCCAVSLTGVRVTCRQLLSHPGFPVVIRICLIPARLPVAGA